MLLVSLFSKSAHVWQCQHFSHPGAHFVHIVLSSRRRSAGPCFRSFSRTSLSAGSYTSALRFVSSSWSICSSFLCPPSATSSASSVSVHRPSDLGFAANFTVAGCVVWKLCGRFLCNRLLCSPPSSSGATSAPTLIFILPGTFYIRIVPQEQEPFLSRPKIQVQLSCFSCEECYELSASVRLN